MTTEKGNFRTVRIAALLLIVALITTTVISGVFAKYTSAFAGEGDITVAKWNITPDNLGTTTPTTFDFTTTAYNNVRDDRIAPGTSGGFSVGFTYDGTEVSLAYTFKLTLPASFPKDRIIISSGTAITPDDTTEPSSLIYTVSGVVSMPNTSSPLSGSVSVPFTWAWSYDDAFNSGSFDSVDTALGIAADTFEATVDLLVVQQEPAS